MSALEPTCPLCAVVAGRVPSHSVYEDEQTLAVLDQQPAVVGHVLLILKTHANYLDDLPPRAGHDLLAVTQRLRRAILASDVPGADVRMFLSDGEPDYKHAPHVHVHIFPRNGADVLEPQLSASDDELAATAIRIRKGVEATDPVAPSAPESDGHRSIFWRDARLEKEH
ncbi:HIT domain-containing protein [Nocardia vinacea]|uniref:HIT domain-containing protein n=1 Tax=Nocardia vinacea TaxID=96468 RepID=A0ABZ1Z7C6_9NOCA|nr:HIT domain-containing protein [Nocardia vinacea]